MVPTLVAVAVAPAAARRAGAAPPGLRAVAIPKLLVPGPTGRTGSARSPPGGDRRSARPQTLLRLERQQVVDRLATANQPRLAAADEDRRRARHRVVRGGHR